MLNKEEQNNKTAPKKGNCGRCGRPLRSKLSLERGFGPSCYKKVAAEKKESDTQDDGLKSFNANADYVLGDDHDSYGKDDFLSKQFVVKAKNLKEANSIAYQEFLRLAKKENIKLNKNSVYIWDIGKNDLISEK